MHLLDHQSIQRIRQDFPILDRELNGHPLVYLDNASTTQKPRSVIQATLDFYTQYNANAGRAHHSLAEELNYMVENTRKHTQRFIHARFPEEIIFTSGCTASLNLLASSFFFDLQEGDEIILSELEHNSNVLPWQFIAEKKSVVLKFLPLQKNGLLDMSPLDEWLGPRTKIISLVLCSNWLGTYQDVKKVLSRAKKEGICSIVDATQAVAHGAINVLDLDCDYLVFSAHKMMGPTGLGVLYGRREKLETLNPAYRGGGTVYDVQHLSSKLADLPERFEAGTQNLAAIAAWSPAMEYLEDIGWDALQSWEQHLLETAFTVLRDVPTLRIFAEENRHRAPVFSFTMEGLHPHDLALFLDSQGICIRTDRHCTHIAHRVFSADSSLRASCYFYNTPEEIHYLAEKLQKASDKLR